jgi:hypothetical protein
MTKNFSVNIFDNSVVVIDEAHNFISRIVTKIASEKEIPMNKDGKRKKVNSHTSLILYELLLSAVNCRIVLLTGTPIINYPNEIGILFNILRGYIKTWKLMLHDAEGRLTDDTIQRIFTKEKNVDYIRYSKDKILTITRNPLGFENIYSKENEYRGITSEKRGISGVNNMIVVQEREITGDEEFEKRILGLLKKNNIEVVDKTIVNYKALPDRLDPFMGMFIDETERGLKNDELFKRRIIGLTSYFKSAQEELMPRYDKLLNLNVEYIPMSKYQYTKYRIVRSEEQEREEQNAKKKKVDNKKKEGELYKEMSNSTYKIFSRLYCNFVFPPEIPRPTSEGSDSDDEVDNADVNDDAVNDDAVDVDAVNDDAVDVDVDAKGKKKELGKGKGKGLGKEKEGQIVEEEVDEDVDEDEDEDKGDGDGDGDGKPLADGLKRKKRKYNENIKMALKKLKEHESEYLNSESLMKYSPKFLAIMENIRDPEHVGLHLVYSQFRTLEGIEIFKMVLETNGFTQFKIKKNSQGNWELNISEENMGKPTFALYTGTENAEEKEVIRNIYNSDWDSKSLITEQLRKMAHNNYMGEIIKVLMITSSGSEGINLRNTRYVHIVEPYWHPVRMEQVIGRARRICSHKSLPVELQTVEVFMYIMILTKDQIENEQKHDMSKKKYKTIEDDEGNVTEYVMAKNDDKTASRIAFTTDQVLHEISNIKEMINSKIILSIKEASIDCAVYQKNGKEQLNCFQFSGDTENDAFTFVPNYEDESVRSNVNKEKVSWKAVKYEINGVTYGYRKIDNMHALLYDFDSLATNNPRIVYNLQHLSNGAIKLTEPKI